MQDKLKVYVGYDSREDIAWQVCQHSIKRHASKDIEVYPLKQPSLRVLLMSGFAEQLDRAKALKSAQVAVISKPFTLEDMRASVRKLIG